jgi:predicted nucleotide-binding protein/uncharacterized SAM-dependent methyltransferase
MVSTREASLSKPLIVIGSSKESSPIAKALQESLGDELSSELWSQLGLPLSHQVLDSLDVAFGEADFAAFILSPDDKLEHRGKKTGATRDNVLIEFGVARGLLDKERAFLVLPDLSEDEFRIPSDLRGITGGTYEYDSISAKATPADLKRTLLDAANTIRAEARRQGFRIKPPQSSPRRVSTVLDRGSTDALGELADAAIYVADKRHEYPTSLRRFVRNGDIVPSKYLYWTPQASEHWLELCKHKKYQFYRKSLKVLRANAEALVEKIVDVNGTAQIDLVSVGSGDGVKDNVLLGHLHRELKSDEFIYYYPVDISDTLIVEAIDKALSGGLPREAFRVKALIADFLKLEKLKPFYEERSATNLFSVLGNTVGNADEDKLLESVSKAMMPGDLVLLEVNVGKASLKDSVWDDVVTREHDFTPLSVLNVQFDSEKMEYSVHQGEGIVDGTNSIVASYKEAKIGRKRVKDIRLSIVHYYDQEHFLAAIQERMNVEVVWHETSGDVLLALARRDTGTG